jgi:hypothetical protein
MEEPYGKNSKFKKLLGEQQAKLNLIRTPTSLRIKPVGIGIPHLVQEREGVAAKSVFHTLTPIFFVAFCLARISLLFESVDERSSGVTCIWTFCTLHTTRRRREPIECLSDKP